MTSFSPEPEFWVEDATDDGSGRDWDDPNWDDGGDDGAPPGGPSGNDRPPPPGPRRWPRWVALAAGLAVIAGLITWQSHAGNAPEATDQTTTQTSPPTTPSTWAPTAAGPVTISTGDPAVPSIIRLTEVDTDALTFSWDGPPTESTAWLPQTSDLRLINQELADATWELVGFGDDGLSRYSPATGELITTQVPRSIGGGTLALLVTADAAIIRPIDSATGFLVPDDKPAEPLAGLLGGSGGALPGPTADGVWVAGQVGTATVDPASGQTAVSGDDMHPELILVDEHGDPLGATLDLPGTAGLDPNYGAVPDGSGFALLYGVGGLYRVGPDGTRLVTHGQVIAYGPRTMLLNECDEHANCSLVVFDRIKDERHPLPGDAAANASAAARGTTSPDGRWAAILDPIPGSVTLVDLETGAMTVPYTDIGWHPGIRLASDALVFTPDSRYLLISNDAGMSLIATATSQPRGLLPVPPQRIIAIRPGS